MGNIWSRITMDGPTADLGKDPVQTIYAGAFVHALALGKLDHSTQAAIGVDAKGKIAFVERDVKDVDALAKEKGWTGARIVRIQENAFFFPGFIGTSSHAIGDTYSKISKC
jgi:guanine deaminase